MSEDVKRFASVWDAIADNPDHAKLLKEWSALKSSNAELLEALRKLEAMAERYRPPGYPVPDAQKVARFAITRAEAAQKGKT